MKIITNSLLLALGISVILFTGCNSDDDENSNPPGAPQNVVQIGTSAASAITQNSALTGGVISSDGGNNIIDRGVCWSEMQSPSLDDFSVSSGMGTGSFSVEITGLSPETTYYVRAFATTNTGTTYGNQQVFTTEEVSLPVVNTLEISEIQSTSATTGGNVIIETQFAVTQRGVCYSSTNSVPTTADLFTSDGFGDGVYLSSLTELTPNTTYFVRAYATNSQGTGYGQTLSFTTSENVEAPCSPPTNTIFFNSQAQTFAVFTGADLNALVFGDYGLVGLGADSDLKVEFSEAPETGVYTTVGGTFVEDSDECAVSGVFGGTFSFLYVATSGNSVYVEKLGTDNYSVTFCDLPFIDASGQGLNWSSDGNLSSN